MPEVIMPKMGDAMTEGKVIRWMKQPGDPVAQGEAIAEIETDKVNVSLEAEWAGVLTEVLVPAGEVAAVGAPIALLARPGEQVVRPPAPTPAKPMAAATDVAPAAALPSAAAKTETPASEGAGPVRASPLARKMAAQHGIPLSAIHGTGPEGRITKGDVEAALAAPSVAASPGGAAVAIPLTRMRQTIARRMTESKQQVPHFYISVTVAMDDALALRRQINDGKSEAERVSINDLTVKAAALALVRFPNINASFADGAVRRLSEVNISIAVALPEGLIVPTLYHCDRKPVWQIAAEARELTERARTGRLRPDDLTGGTFTLSNLGMFDVDTFAAIINPPQAAILAVGTARPQAVVREGSLAVATVMQATLSADHRVTDGVEAAQFLGEVRRLLENPVGLVIERPAG
ncbi:MAG: dihydrolipoamide acetyltransferase family protein [bacterium]|nr:dihydrolipoamide acetyltransferase family protein [bacterium]